jgi:hypothetical protein
MKTTLLIGPIGNKMNQMAALLVGKKKFKVIKPYLLESICFLGDRPIIKSDTIPSDTEVLIFEDACFPTHNSFVANLKKGTSIAVQRPAFSSHFEIAPDLLFLSQNSYNEIVTAFGNKAELSNAFNAVAEIEGDGQTLESLVNALMGNSNPPTETPIVEYFEKSLKELNDGYETIKDNIRLRWPVPTTQQSFNDMLETIAELKALVTLAAHNMRTLNNFLTQQKNAHVIQQ